MDPEVLIQESPAARGSDDGKQQQSFCDANNNNSSNNNITQSYTDVEDHFPKIGGINSISNSDSNDDEENDNENRTMGSYWDVFATLYVPLILLWFRRSMFGPANLARSIIVGQLMRIVFFDNISEWVYGKLLPLSWLDVILLHGGQSGAEVSASSSSSSSSSHSHVSMVLGTVVNGKPDPHAWPPPAFTALALLTIFALVVHPDGLTWIILGKLRDALSALVSALGRSLEFVVNDYGVFPTLIASATLAGMFFVVFVVLRTLSPKTCKANSNSNNKNFSNNNNNNSNNNNSNNNTHNNERKKKKKKGGNGRHRREHHHHNHHHRLNRIKYSSQQLVEPPQLVEDASTSTTQTSLSSSSSSPLPSSPPSANDATTDSTTTTLHLPSLSSSSTSTSTSTSTTIATNVSSDESENTKPCMATTNTNENSTSTTACTSTGTTNNNKCRDNNNNRSRRRMMSASTLDTIPMSDDQSCGSTSVRSYPSVSISVNSNRSGGRVAAAAGHHHNNNKGSVCNSRRGKRNGKVKSPKNNAERSNSNGKKNKGSPSAESLVSSRWDALKPENGSNNNVGHSSSSSSSSNNSYNNHHHHHANGNGNVVNKKQPRFQRGNGRRGPGNNGNGSNNRKGRPNQNSFTNNEQRPSVLSSSANNIRSKVHEVLPPASTRQNKDFNSSTAAMTASTSIPLLNSYSVSPQPNNSINVPAPPPGFQNVPIASSLEKNKKDLHQRPKNNNFKIPPLFETPPLILNHTSRAAIIAPPPPQYNGAIASHDLFPPASFVPSYGGLSNGGSTSSTKIQENPFRNDNNNIHDITMPRYHQEHLDSQIEADLQELGGQMAGSILDF